MADTPILTIQQLPTLASLVYKQEEQAIHNVQFHSELARVQFLQDCRACYDSAVAFFDKANDLENKYSDNITKSSIASDIFGYIINATNFALQLLHNYHLRMDYMTKIKDHIDELLKKLEDVADNDMIELAKLAKEASDFRTATLDSIKQRQTAASREFAESLKQQGLNFEDLINIYKNKRGFEGPFKDLDDEDKIGVYGDIIKWSGRSDTIAKALSKHVGGTGIAVIVLTAGVLVWDLFTSHDIFKTSTYDAVTGVASIGGALVGEIVGETIALAVGATPAFVMLAGIITSFVGAYLIGEFAGWLINSIFGGAYDITSTEGLRCYVAELPDGESIARQIIHHTD